MREYLFESPRMGFGCWQAEDLALAQLLWGNREVTRYISENGVFSPDEIAARLSREIENGKRYGIQYWPLFFKETGDFFGCCGLRPYKGALYEAGVHLLPAYWHRGLGSEAMARVIRYGLTERGAEDIFAGHNPHNTASKRMLLGLGFHPMGEEYYAPTGLMHPSYLYRGGR